MRICELAEELEKENVVPSCAPELAFDGSLGGFEASRQGEIFGAVVLAVPGVVLVRGHVGHPVQTVLDAPAVADDGAELARTALYEAAHFLLMRSSGGAALRAWGMQVAKRRGMARARVAVARKLAVILHRIWTDGSAFRWGRQTTAAAVVA